MKPQCLSADMRDVKMIKKVNTIVKRLLLWWDPDFTKVTPKERKALEDADKEMKNGEYFTDDEVWNNE